MRSSAVEASRHYLWLTGMPVLGLIYPCRYLADTIDPLRSASEMPALDVVWKSAVDGLEEPLARLMQQFQQADRGTRPDRNWYWAAPLLLDLVYYPDETRVWFAREDLPEAWQHVQDDDAAEGWRRHVERAQALIAGNVALGPPPANLAKVLARLALGAPGIVVLRAMQRGRGCDLRSHAAPVAHAFLHLFNLPDARALIEKSTKRAYWLEVARYTARANLQAVMDEYIHVLSDESLDDIRDMMIAALTLRAASVKADLYETRPRSVKPDPDPFHFSCRFAMRFGVDEVNEEGNRTTRADQVRTAFNSPFWPFVLATTSIGQEGLDFHRYCHAVVHWNLPSNPVDLEQREGRVHRFKGHAVRKNHAHRVRPDACDPWQTAFDDAVASNEDDPHLRAFWLATDGEARIERHVPAYPQSRDVERLRTLEKSLVLYRMVFGQNRQEDLVRFLETQLDVEQIDNLSHLCRIDLRPRSGL